jgi:hypothetical protein
VVAAEFGLRQLGQAFAQSVRGESVRWGSIPLTHILSPLDYKK